MKPSLLLHHLLNIQHFLVDAICLACIMDTVTSQFDIRQENQAIALTLLIVLYNTLAFCTQWTTGLCCDILQNDRSVHPVYTILLLAGTAVCLWSPVTGIILIGTGNSIFHVVGGRTIIRRYGAKAAPLGLFVAPGALGVYFGTAFSNCLWLYCLALLLNAIAIITLQKGDLEPIPQETKSSGNENIAKTQAVIVSLVLLCVICRAASGSVPLAGGKFVVPWLWLPVTFVFLGKSAGGFLGDRFGIGLAGTIELLLGTLCLAFRQNHATFLAGQFLMNLLMPLTLYILAQTLPSYPGMAFGLAASVLYPGSLVRLTWNPRLVLLTLSAGSVLCFGAAWLLFLKYQTKSHE